MGEGGDSVKEIVLIDIEQSNWSESVTRTLYITYHFKDSLTSLSFCTSRLLFSLLPIPRQRNLSFTVLILSNSILFVCCFSALGQLLLFQILAVLPKNTPPNPAPPVGARSFYKRPVCTIWDRGYHSAFSFSLLWFWDKEDQSAQVKEEKKKKVYCTSKCSAPNCYQK